jgi:hypothetical protein
MKLFSLLFAVAAAITPACATERAPSPLSVVQALMDAEAKIDLKLATSLFADDAVIVNVAGAKSSGAELRRFIETDMWLRESFALEQATVEPDRVIWSQSITAEFYRNIGVDPVRFVFSANVRDGKIQSIVAHVPSDDIARIESSCRRQTPEPLIYGRPCSEFIQFMKAETAFATGRAALDIVKAGVD